MTIRRSKTQVAVDILKVINSAGGVVGPTHILYKANLSHALLKQHVSDLLGKGLIKESLGSKKGYSITTKGRKFLQEFKKVEEFSLAFGMEL